MKKLKVRVIYIFLIILNIILVSLFVLYQFQINEMNSRKAVDLNRVNSSRIVFYKDDCPDCQKLFKYFYFSGKNIQFVNLNNVYNKRYINDYKLKYVPTYVIIKGGKVVKKVDGINKNNVKYILKE